MENELEQAFKSAWSIENMAAHVGVIRDVEYIGSVTEGPREYLLYKDTMGAYWYRSRNIDNLNPRPRKGSNRKKLA